MFVTSSAGCSRDGRSRRLARAGSVNLMSDFVDLFDLAAQEMLRSLEQSRAALSHGLSKGEANESIVRTFLEDRLPKSVGIGRGQIVDKYGNKSKQLDVIIFDALNTPVLWVDDANEHRLFPSESVRAVIEVRTRLHASDVPSIIKNMLSVKSLDKTSFYSGNTGPIEFLSRVYGEAYELVPTFYFVFAFESGQLDRIYDAISAGTAETPISSRIDCMVSLEHGVMLWQDPDAENVSAVPEGSDWNLKYVETDYALLLFYLLVSRFLFQVDGRPVNLIKYLPKMTFGSATGKRGK